MVEEICFETEDNIELHGLLYPSCVKTNKVILAVHGMSSNCMKARDEIIAKEANKQEIDYFCFNNRGHDLMCYVDQYRDGKRKKILGGSSFEDVLDSYYDIVGAIVKLQALGYSNIYLQGHSLGCTKIVYTYHRLKKEKRNHVLQLIRAVILLSMVDIYEMQHYFLQERFDEVLQLAEEKEQQGKFMELLPMDSFIHPVSVKTYLRYVKYNQDLQFPKYSAQTDTLPELNEISSPLFMRWGNENELILQPAEELVNMVTNKLKKPAIDINYIDGAGHNYQGKEETLAKEIVTFILKYKE